MATVIIGAATGEYSHSIRSGATQTGINVESISISTEPEFREDLLQPDGHVQGQAVGDTMTTLTISGEVVRSTDGNAFLGVFLDTFQGDSDATLTIETDFASGGGQESEFILQSSETTQTRGSFESGTVTYIARANLTPA